MLPDHLQIALKEWAVVQRALLEGRQIMLLRKGGIVEESGDFDLRARQFLIQPTYLHETERAGDLQPCFAELLAEEERRKTPERTIRFEAACEIADVVRISRPDALIELAGQHIWSEQFIRGRFEWEPYKPVFVLLIRAYALEQAVAVPFNADYAGCKSWIDLNEPVSTTQVVPAIRDDESFARRVELTKELLEG